MSIDMRINPKNGRKILAQQGKDGVKTLKANPLVQHVPNDHIEFYVWQNFLSPQECQTLIALIDKGAQPSSLYEESAKPGFRTSSSCNLDPYAPLTVKLDRKISEAIGMNPRHSETIQGQRYKVGQEFKPHHDYFHTSTDYWKHESVNGGQRSWTVMVFLNDVEEGGATEFPDANLGVRPLAGMLLAWNNMARDGTPNPYTLHTGTPVIKGTKYIITKWFRQNQWY